MNLINSMQILSKIDYNCKADLLRMVMESAEVFQDIENFKFMEKRYDVLF